MAYTFGERPRMGNSKGPSTSKGGGISLGGQVVGGGGSSTSRATSSSKPTSKPPTMPKPPVKKTAPPPTKKPPVKTAPGKTGQVVSAPGAAGGMPPVNVAVNYKSDPHLEDAWKMGQKNIDEIYKGVDRSAQSANRDIMAGAYANAYGGADAATQRLGAGSGVAANVMQKNLEAGQRAAARAASDMYSSGRQQVSDFMSRYQLPAAQTFEAGRARAGDQALGLAQAQMGYNLGAGNLELGQGDQDLRNREFEWQMEFDPWRVEQQNQQQNQNWMQGLYGNLLL